MAAGHLTVKRETKTLRGSEIKKILSQGTVFTEEYFKIFVLRPAQGFSRLGVLTPRKLGKAVIRNRLRRCFKEGLRLLSVDFQPRVDAVILPLAKACQLSTPEVKTRLMRALSKLKVIGNAR